MQLSDIGEFGLIRRIQSHSAGDPTVIIGIGDDCAVTRSSPETVTLSTTDMLVERVHFDLSFTSPYLLGRKSLAVNLSDIAACGGIPRHALLSLALPKDLPLTFIDDFIRGFTDLASEQRVTLIGGDTCASPGPLIISVTLTGEQKPEMAVLRSGAQQGDLILVSGTLGDSALGLKLLQGGYRVTAETAPHPAVQRHLDPAPRNALALSIASAGLATAMIDISDGLCADLGHILELSGCGALLDLPLLPRSEALREAALSGEDTDQIILAGGEDYELLWTISPDKVAELTQLRETAGVPLTVIGSITSEQGLLLRKADGSIVLPTATGYNHFV